MAAKPSVKPKYPIIVFKTKNQKRAFKSAVRASLEAQQNAPKYDFSRVKRIGFGESDIKRID
ncbi:MAG: hypothetical protein LBC28_05720 [Oscillospiraceae bacterium]|nr:hypothetical protein [Oscillospiraceae bacterium]